MQGDGGHRFLLLPTCTQIGILCNCLYVSFVDVLLLLIGYLDSLRTPSTTAKLWNRRRWSNNSQSQPQIRPRWASDIRSRWDVPALYSLPRAILHHIRARQSCQSDLSKSVKLQTRRDINWFLPRAFKNCPCAIPSRNNSLLSLSIGSFAVAAFIASNVNLARDICWWNGLVKHSLVHYVVLTLAKLLTWIEGLGLLTVAWLGDIDFDCHSSMASINKQTIAYCNVLMISKCGIGRPASTCLFCAGAEARSLHRAMNLPNSCSMSTIFCYLLAWILLAHCLFLKISPRLEEDRHGFYSAELARCPVTGRTLWSSLLLYKDMLAWGDENSKSARNF